MGDFSAEWLALREPADHAARSAGLTRALADRLGGAVIRVLDLGSGTGSNLRYLAPRLPRPQQWLLVDRDAALLADARARLGDVRDVETRELDLRRIGDVSTRSMFDGRALVTASALLDLVSEPWMESLADACRGASASVLFALTYDGRIGCTPHDEGDRLVARLANEHQRRDKGFGLALGPAAAASAARAFLARGYRVERDRSDWELAPESAALQRELVEGWASAASEIAPAHATAIDAWRGRRLEHIGAGRSAIRVGHEDLAAWTPSGT